MKFILLITLFFFTVNSIASNDKVFTITKKYDLKTLNISIDTTIENINKTKVIAVTLAVTLGVFGVHRLYLGTKPLVPIAYTLTLGGGMGILPVIDIIYIITAKDINQLKNNNFIFMWNKNK